MEKTVTIRMGKRGTIVIPASIRKQAGLTDGELVILELNPDGILIRHSVTLPLEKYSARRQAEFLLSNAVTPAEYAWAREEVGRLGLDPDEIEHYRPKGD